MAMITNIGGTGSTTTLDTTNFAGNLSAADSDVQKAMDTLDNMSVDGGGGSIELFGAGVLLDLSADPAGGEVPNLGLFGADATFEITGSWAKESDYIWATSSGTPALGLQPHHTESTSGASFNSVNLTDGSASFVIDDTNNDLSVLFDSAVTATTQRRVFKLDASSNAASRNYISGYIGGVSKSSNTYTFSMYNSALGTTRNWHKYSQGTWNGSDVTWMIYPAFFEVDDDTRKGFALGFWLYNADATTDYNVLAGKYFAWLNSGEDIGYGYMIQQSATDYATSLMTSYATNSVSTISVTSVLHTSRWQHIAYIQNRTDNLRYFMINGEVVSVTSGTYNHTCAMGLFSFMSGHRGSGALAVGSKCAFPRFWRGDIDYGLITSVYNYERNLLELGLNH